MFQHALYSEEYKIVAEQLLILQCRLFLVGGV